MADESYAPKSPDLSSFFSAPTPPTPPPQHQQHPYHPYHHPQQQQQQQQQQQHQQQYQPQHQQPPPHHQNLQQQLKLQTPDLPYEYQHHSTHSHFSNPNALPSAPASAPVRQEPYHDPTHVKREQSQSASLSPRNSQDYLPPQYLQQQPPPPPPQQQQEYHQIPPSIPGQPAYGHHYQPQYQHQPPNYQQGVPLPGQPYGNLTQSPYDTVPQPYGAKPAAGQYESLHPGFPSHPQPLSPNTETMPPRRAASQAAPPAAPAEIEPSPVRTKFPTARIKRIMQADEEVGKVAQQTPIAVGKALEIFMVNVVSKSAEIAREKNSKRVTAQMLKQVIETDGQYDFLADIAAKVGEEDRRSKGGAKAESESSEEEMEVEAPPATKKRGRGSASAAGGARKKKGSVA